MNRAFKKLNQSVINQSMQLRQSKKGNKKTLTHM